MIPANFIPPRYREFVYEDLTEEEIEATIGCMSIIDDNGRRPVTRQEFLDSTGGHRVIGVRDTRTGKVHYNVS